MRTTFWIIGGALGLSLLIFASIELYYSTDIIPIELYVGIIVILAVGLITWAFNRIESSSPEKPQKKEFRRNERAVKSLNISEEELRVLEQLAKGRSNQEISDTLKLSPNKVKTTLTGVYKKLEVDRRSKAAKKARSLKLVP